MRWYEERFDSVYNIKIVESCDAARTHSINNLLLKEKRIK